MTNENLKLLKILAANAPRNTRDWNEYEQECLEIEALMEEEL